ncbi:hypothetical protein Bca4012_021819 [Brassica carinata]
MSDEEEPRCPVSDPAQPHNLSTISSGDVYKSTHNCFACGTNDVFRVNIFTMKPLELWRHRYYCTKCDLEFHKRCVKFPSKMIHPYHPQHPLTFTFLNHETGIMADTKYGAFCKFLSLSDLDMSQYLKSIGIRPKPNIMFDTCTWCGHDLGEWFYCCSICNFSLDFNCTINIPPLTIQNPKSHHHSLTLFPRPLLSPCDACGLINVLEPSYACYQCSYVVHKSCIDLPRVIKITRHPHRLHHIPSLPAKVRPCRVCYKNVDIKYGQYSCNHEDCSYVVHSKCATHEKVWDGKELEWEEEEAYQTEDFAPFKTVGDNLIEHIYHPHHYLRLEKHDGGSEKQCHACIRPINTCYDFYNCIKCDFFLHEVCANLPRKLDHALHKHPLFLDTGTPADMSEFLSCSACTRFSSGFRYKCKERGCYRALYKPFVLDINCILVPEWFTHKSHEDHLVFISTSYSYDDDELICQGCKESIHVDHLHCTLCKYALCYKCATIPNEIYHKYDEHPLSLCYGETGVDDVWWCEVCEERLDPTEWFYTSSKNCTTIHHKCLFRDSAYMKSGHVFGSARLEVVSNGSSSRPICSLCHQYCLDNVYFKSPYEKSRNVFAFIACSIVCLERNLSWLLHGAAPRSKPPSRPPAFLRPPPPPPPPPIPIFDSITREA